MEARQPARELPSPLARRPRPARSLMAQAVKESDPMGDILALGRSRRESRRRRKGRDENLTQDKVGGRLPHVILPQFGLALGQALQAAQQGSEDINLGDEAILGGTRRYELT